MAAIDEEESEYSWSSSDAACSVEYVVVPVLALLAQSTGKRVLDLGCGNGALSALLAQRGYEVKGLDGSRSGIEVASQKYPGLTFAVHDISDPLPEDHRGTYDAVVSTEVIEHLYLPGRLLERALEALKPNGLLVVSTPYHGYLKNLCLAVAGKWDFHHTSLRDYGHVKFFSRATLSALFARHGFEVAAFRTAGRIPLLAKSMVMAGYAPPRRVRG